MENSKRGIILMNLGSPDSTEVPDLRKYLNEFLTDKRVIDSWFVRNFLVRTVIVPRRAPESAKAYQTIWTKNGSPLVEITKQLARKLQEQLPEPVAVAMRYGNPGMEQAYEDLLKRLPGLEEVTAIPLYPHYAMSSYETAVEHAKEVHQKKKYKFNLKFIQPIYQDKRYIRAMSENMRPYLEKEFDHLLFSFHGIPERHVKKTDPTHNHCLATADCCTTPSIAHLTCYRHQCLKTMNLVAEKLGLATDKYSFSFQSRLLKDPWLKPYTDLRLQEMPKEGIKKLMVVCPAFVSDCLETLEEIEIRGRESFLASGGTEFEMIPCLNTHPLWVQTLADLTRD
ncbi:MAG TPA: ferrochelatase [Puia sp.]|nr:ferrochelatase [Puia sp.]